MTWEWLALGATALSVIGLVLVLAGLKRRTATELAAARAEAEELRARLERLEQEPPVQAPGITLREQQEYRITRVGEPEPDADASGPAHVDRAVFADLLLKETVIRVGSLAHGFRRALSPEARNRIRFEMGREVKRARKQRRVEQREAYRQWRARQRELLRDDDLRESA